MAMTRSADGISNCCILYRPEKLQECKSEDYAVAKAQKEAVAKVQKEAKWKEIAQWE